MGLLSLYLLVFSYLIRQIKYVKKQNPYFEETWIMVTFTTLLYLDRRLHIPKMAWSYFSWAIECTILPWRVPRKSSKIFWQRHVVLSYILVKFWNLKSDTYAFLRSLTFSTYLLQYLHVRAFSNYQVSNAIGGKKRKSFCGVVVSGRVSSKIWPVIHAHRGAMIPVIDIAAELYRYGEGNGLVS